MLPNHSRTLGQRTTDLGWVQAHLYRVEVPEPAATGGESRSYEQHAIVQLEGRVAYDFFATATTEKGLATLEPMLLQMVGSAQVKRQRDSLTEHCG